MIFAFTHITGTADYDLRNHCYMNKPKARAKTLAWMVNWMKENNHQDYYLWCNSNEFVGWISYDYARYLLATGKRIAPASQVNQWIKQNPE